jgi:phosphatidyl-myo-inositol dimannoside synthase
MTAAALRVGMLLTDGFGGIGGIAKFNRDFLKALDACSVVERVHVQPRLIPEQIEEVIPEAVVYDRTAARGKLSFLSRFGGLVLRGGPLDLVVCGHLHLLPVALILARLRRARLALIIHGLEAWQPTCKPLVNLSARSVDAVISVSRLSAERFSGWAKVAKDCFFILPNCVDLNRFTAQPRDAVLTERYGLQKSRVILTVGRLATQERYKGFDEVLDIMPQLVNRIPNLKYLIAGDGPDRTRLEAKTKALKMADRVIFTGYVPETEKVAHYNLADAYVMPSSGEGFGIVLLEAAACGVPVIGSRTDGSREALRNGLLGRLVDPHKPEELFEAIGSVLKKPSIRARRNGVEMFSPENFRARVADWCRAQTVAAL